MRHSRWQMSDATLIFRNSLQNIYYTVPGSASAVLRVGLGVDISQGSTFNPAINWRTTLYGNSCSNVDIPVSDFGLGTLRYCSAATADSCECAGVASADVGVLGSRTITDDARIVRPRCSGVQSGKSWRGADCDGYAGWNPALTGRGSRYFLGYAPRE